MDIIKAEAITKRFPGVLALDNVSMRIEPGKIHCIIGENGAGKSTLIKCFTGLYKPNDGQIFIEGENVTDNPENFEKVAYVPQEVSLFEHMIVAENLFLPFRDNSGWRIQQTLINKKAQPVLDRFHLKIAPDDLVKDISVSEKQLLQVARATMQENYSVLILDEPTTSLTSSDVDLLFGIIETIRNSGKAIIFISHKLEEIFAIGDVVTVLRNGKVVASDLVKTVDEDWIISHMTGKMIDRTRFYGSEKVSEDVVLSVKNLSGEMFENVSFDLRKGEILGFSGLIGSGRSELMQALFGYLPYSEGQVTLDGHVLKPGDTNESVSRGLFYLPEDRKTLGILPMMSVRENITISSLDDHKKGSFISKKSELKAASDKIIDYDIKTPSTEQDIVYLSGGNQQKSIIARVMSCQPKVIIFDEPTKGIDVGAKAAIYEIMKVLAEEKQIGIILISSEMDEVIHSSNRILALYKGSISREFGQHAEKQEIMNAIFGRKQQEVNKNEQ